MYAHREALYSSFGSRSIEVGGTCVNFEGIQNRQMSQGNDITVAERTYISSHVLYPISSGFALVELAPSYAGFPRVPVSAS